MAEIFGNDEFLFNEGREPAKLVSGVGALSAISLYCLLQFKKYLVERSKSLKTKAKPIVDRRLPWSVRSVREVSPEFGAYLDEVSRVLEDQKRTLTESAYKEMMQKVQTELLPVIQELYSIDPEAATRLRSKLVELN